MQKLALHAASSYIAFGLAFITSLIMSRALGPEGRGEISFLMTGAFMVAAISKLGYSQWIVANGELAARFTIYDLIKIIHWCSLPLVVSTAVIVVVDESQRGLWLYVTLALYVLLQLFNELVASLMMARLFLTRYAYLQLLQPAVLLLLCCALWAFDELTVVSFLYSNIFSLTVSVLISCRSLQSNCTNAEGGFESLWLLSKVRDNLKVYFASSIKDITYRIDFLFVGLFFGDQQLGFFSLAVMFMEIPLKMVDVVGNHLLRGTLMRAEVKLSVRFILTVVVAITALFFMVYFVSFYFLVPNFLGSEFFKSAEIFLLLYPACLFVGLWKIFANFLIRTQNGNGYLESVLVGLLLKVVIFMIFQAEGLSVVILAMTLAYLGMFLTLLFRGMKIRNGW
jgi:O-antigen/teichoic acid export membrane protein